MKTTQTKTSARHAISAAGTSRPFPWPPVRGAVWSGLRLLLACLALAAMTRATAQEYTFTTLAGPDDAGPGAVDGTGTNAQFNAPEGVAVDSAGNVYVGDTGNCTIRKVTPGGVVTTLAGLAGTSGSADGKPVSVPSFYTFQQKPEGEAERRE